MNIEHQESQFCLKNPVGQNDSNSQNRDVKTEIPVSERTFLELEPSQRNPETARFHIVPIPYEGTVCFKSGTINGPAAILDVSDQMEHLDEETFLSYAAEGIHTYPEIPPAETPLEEMQRIEETIRSYDLFRPDRFPIFLGGEHSISAPLIKLAVERYSSDLSVLQFDAHSDLRDSYTGGKQSHACVMRRALEWTSHLVQVGIRSFSEHDLIECPNQVKNFIPPHRLEDDFDGTVELIINRLKPNVYITFDMDAFDPSEAPGVGTPEPGGLRWRQVCKILRAVCKARNIIGADVVETAPLTFSPSNVEKSSSNQKYEVKSSAFNRSADNNPDLNNPDLSNPDFNNLNVYAADTSKYTNNNGSGNVITEYLAVRLIGKLIVYNRKSSDGQIAD